MVFYGSVRSVDGGSLVWSGGICRGGGVWDLGVIVWLVVVVVVGEVGFGVVVLVV